MSRWLEYRHVIVNADWKAEAFISGIEKHLGEMHEIHGREKLGELEGKDVEQWLVGFGGETWRGKIFYVGGTLRALELLPNFDCTPQRLTMATCGLAVLTWNKYALFGDVLAWE